MGDNLDIGKPSLELRVFPIPVDLRWYKMFKGVRDVRCRACWLVGIKNDQWREIDRENIKIKEGEDYITVVIKLESNPKLIPRN